MPRNGFAPVYILISLAVVVVTVGAFVIQKTTKVTPVINSFEECIKAGYPALESNPRQCKTPNGKSFTEQLPTPTPDETVDWKTYINRVYGYSIKYPPTWINANDCQGCRNSDPVNDETGRIFNSGKENGTGVDLEISSNKATTFALMSDVIKHYSWKDKKIEDVEIDGVEAIKVSGFEYNGKRNVAVVFEKGGNIYKIQTWLDHASIFDQMLSTFKFLDQVLLAPQLAGSGIKGRITVGPTCPVVGPGMEKECADKPYQGTIIVKTIDGSKEVTRFTSEKDGSFQTELDPGKYSLESEPGKSQIPFLKPQTVTVEANQYTESAISFDSGIR